MTDRALSLAELAARASQRETLKLSGKRGQPAPSGSNCHNPECRKGLTPGLVALGGGEKGRPLFGEGGVGAKRLMRWGWVRCLACNPPEDSRRAGAIYKRLNLSADEIAQRAALATQRASYTPPQETRKSASRNRAAAREGFAPDSADAGRLAELLEQNKKLSAQVMQLTTQITEQTKASTEATLLMGRLSAQVAALLEDNAKLRKELECKSTGAPVPATATR